MSLPPASATWWQTLPFRIDPYIVQIGSFRVGWYGMMYVAAFVTMYLVTSRRIGKERAPYTDVMLQDWLVACAFGLIIGARLGYVVFYNPGYYLGNPLEIFLPISFTPAGIRYTGIAGMSYHGGVIGATVATVIMLRNRNVKFTEWSDFVVPVIPLCYTWGRLGNFINGELWGRAAQIPWGMYFPSDRQGLLRHPSQLYEAFGEGILLYLFLDFIRKRPGRTTGSMVGWYLIGYGSVRFVVEFFREPDAHLGFITLGMSMGQLLCSAMIISGTGYILWLKRGK